MGSDFFLVTNHSIYKVTLKLVTNISVELSERMKYEEAVKVHRSGGQRWMWISKNSKTGTSNETYNYNERPSNK